MNNKEILVPANCAAMCQGALEGLCSILHPATLSFVESSLLIKEKLRFLFQNTAMYSDPTRGAEADPAVTMQRMPRLLYTSTLASVGLPG